jgi:hypothetical protein
MNLVLKKINTEIPVNISIIIVPFFLSLYFLLFPKQIFKDSIISRLVAVFIIIYYTYIHVLYGVFACILILLYQNDIEAFRPETENILPIPIIETPAEKSFETPDKSFETPDKSLETPDKSFETSSNITGTQIQMAYPSINARTLESEHFLKHCKLDKLMYRNLEVKHPEIIPQLFPEVSFDTPCNPCNPTCAFTVSKIKTEQDIAPKSAHGSDFSYLMEWTESFYKRKPEPYIGVKSANASYV